MRIVGCKEMEGEREEACMREIAMWSELLKISKCTSDDRSRGQLLLCMHA